MRNTIIAILSSLAIMAAVGKCTFTNSAEVDGGAVRASSTSE